MCNLNGLSMIQEIILLRQWKTYIITEVKKGTKNIPHIVAGNYLSSKIISTVCEPVETRVRGLSL